MLTGPCKDCTERHLSCHSDCERYLSYVKEKDAVNKQIREKKYHEDQYMGLVTRKWRR